MDPVAYGVRTEGTRFICAVRSQHSGDPGGRSVTQKGFWGLGMFCHLVRVLLAWVGGILMA